MSEIVTHTSVTTPTDGIGETKSFTEDQIKEFNITPEELEAAGQAPEQEEQPKLAGKFDSQEELTKAYLELEKKLHSPKEETQEAATEETVEQPKEGNSNVEVKAAFEELMKSGEVTDEVVGKFESAGIPREMVEKVAELEQFKATRELAEIHNIAGSQDDYKGLIGWAADNLPPDEIDTFNAIVDKGSHAELKFAVTNLHARRGGNSGQRPSNLIKASADTSSSSESGYKTQAHMLSDIADARYKTDPGFRDKVMAKAGKSNF